MLDELGRAQLLAFDWGTAHGFGGVEEDGHRDLANRVILRTKVVRCVIISRHFLFRNNLPKPCCWFSVTSLVDFCRLNQSKPSKFFLDRVLVVKEEGYPILCPITIRTYFLTNSICTCVLRYCCEDQHTAGPELTVTVYYQFLSLA